MATRRITLFSCRFQCSVLIDMDTANNFADDANSIVGVTKKLSNNLIEDSNQPQPRVSSGKEAHRCPYQNCNFSSTWKASLNNHKKTHTGINVVFRLWCSCSH